MICPTRHDPTRRRSFPPCQTTKQRASTIPCNSLCAYPGARRDLSRRRGSRSFTPGRPGQSPRFHQRHSRSAPEISVCPHEVAVRCLTADVDTRTSQQAVSLSYNGGKDCLVLLILYLCVLAQRHSLRPTSSETYTNGASPSRLADHLPNALPAVYIVSAHPFAAVDSFVETSAQEYALDVVYLSGFARSMREAFAAYLNPRPEVEAIFVGTRRTDPHGAKLSAFNMTDRGWPSFMRIHPVLDWKYREIWAVSPFTIPETATCFVYRSLQRSKRTQGEGV